MNSSLHFFQARAQEKYDRAVMKINQLKEEREELRGKVDAQTVETSMWVKSALYYLFSSLK